MVYGRHKSFDEVRQERLARKSEEILRGESAESRSERASELVQIDELSDWLEGESETPHHLFLRVDNVRSGLSPIGINSTRLHDDRIVDSQEGRFLHVLQFQPQASDALRP